MGISPIPRKNCCCCLSGLLLGPAFYQCPLGCKAQQVTPIVLSYFQPQAYATYASNQSWEIPSYEWYTHADTCDVRQLPAYATYPFLRTCWHLWHQKYQVAYPVVNLGAASVHTGHKTSYPMELWHIDTCIFSDGCGFEVFEAVHWLSAMVAQTRRTV